MHNIFGISCSVNSLKCNNLKSNGWDTQIIWMGQAGHMKGIREFHMVL